MDSNYPPDAFHQQGDRSLQPSQPPQQQQHAAHYPFDVPIPYPVSHHHQQSAYAVDQPSRVFPTALLLSPGYHDTGPAHSKANNVQPECQERPVTLDVQGVKSTYLPASYAPPITTCETPTTCCEPAIATQEPTTSTHEPAITTREPPIAPHEPAITVHEPPIAPREPAITVHEPPITAHEPAITTSEPFVTPREPAITVHEPPIAPREPAITVHEPAITTSEPFVTPCEPVSTTHEPPITAHEPVEWSNIPVTTCESFAESNIPCTAPSEPSMKRSTVSRSPSELVVGSYCEPITVRESAVKSATLHPEDLISVEKTSLKLTESSRQAGQHPTIIAHPGASPQSAENSDEEPLIFSALNLRKTSSIKDLPSSLSLRVAPRDQIAGVVAKKTIEKGAEFGPYRGDLLSEEDGWSKDTTWEICVGDGMYIYRDGRKMWMSHVRCAQKEEELNMEAYQSYGEIYYRCTKVIEPGSELKVFYSKEYRKHVGIKTSLRKLKFDQDAQKFQCSQCDDLFTSAKLILRHVRCEHALRKGSQLIPSSRNKICRKPTRLQISSKHLFKRRIQVSDQNGPVFKCGTCHKAFPSSGRLKAHEVFHDYDQDHTCPICGKRQKNAQAWASHMKYHRPVNESRPHKCNECNARYKRKDSLRRHQHQIHGYPCRVCSERFSRKKDCMTHEQTHQEFIPPYAGVKYLAPAPSPDEPVDFLGKKRNYRQLPFKCRFCPNRYSNHKSAMMHEKENHTMEGTFKCSHCPRIFSCESRLKAHLLIHEQTRIYRCALCPKGFASKSALSSHEEEHTGLKPAKCDVCGKGFKTRKNALAHKRRVHQNRPKRFICSFCNYGFAYKNDLQKHEDRHKGIRRHGCPECSKRFTSNTSLTAHIQAIHRKERPFSCQICGQSFSLNFKYTLHMVKHNFEGGSSNSIQH